jgi:hypothetical protein
MNDTEMVEDTQSSSREDACLEMRLPHSVKMSEFVTGDPLGLYGLRLLSFGNEEMGFMHAEQCWSSIRYYEQMK